MAESKLEKVREVYDNTVPLLHYPAEWERMVKQTAKYWRTSLCEAMLTNEQIPNATVCGTVAQWNKVGRYVNQGEKSIGVFKRREDNNLKHVFDISQTHGRAFVPRWTMSKRIASGIVTKHNAENPKEKVNSLEEFLQKALDNNADLCYNLMQELGCTAESEIRITRIAKETARCIVMTRCGIELDDYDFTDVGKLKAEVSLMDIGNAASEVAQSVLKDVDRMIRRREYERYGGQEYSIRRGRDSASERRADLVRGGSEVLSSIHDKNNRNAQKMDSDVRAESERLPILSDGRGLRTQGHPEVGTEGVGYDERDGQDGIRYDKHERAVHHDLGGDSRESGQSGVGNDRSVEKADEVQRGLHNEGIAERGDSSSGAGRSMGNNPQLRGVASTGGSELRNLGADIEDNAEHDDTNDGIIEVTDGYLMAESYEDSASSVSEDGQLSLFTDTYDLNANQDNLLFGEYTRESLLHDEIIHYGSGFVDWRQRITDFFAQGPATATFANFLKKEYGIGGHSNLEFGNTDYNGRGLFITVPADEGNLVVRYTWNEVAQGYATAISNNEIIVPKQEETKTEQQDDEEENAIAAPIDTESHDESEVQTLTAYRVGDFYEIYGSDAEKAASALGLQTTERSNEPMTGFPVFSLDNCSAKLSEQGYTLLVADRRENDDLYEQQNAQDTFLLGREIILDNRRFVVDNINEKAGKADLRDITFENGVGFPVFRTENLEYVRQLLGLEQASATEQPEEKPNAANAEQNTTMSPAAPAPVAQNYRFPDDFAYASTPKAKFIDNITAIKTLRQIERERRAATPSEQDALAKYSGWGGLANAFNEHNTEWHEENVQLRDLLSEKEYESAKESTLNAFYTEPYIINSIYTALESFGFKGGVVLDPSMGTGNFYGNMPAAMAENSKLYGVELDELTAKIARALYPKANIQNSGFESTSFDNNTFDVVVGNVPFGNYSPFDPSYKDSHYLVHDLFFIKSLDKLKAGGIAALITSTGTLDKEKERARLEMYKRADLIGAIRLPDNAFKTAGTKTATDILFFQKLDHEREVDKQDLPDWIYRRYKQLDRMSWKTVVYNGYFAEHPEMVLGKLDTRTGQYGQQELIVTADEDSSTADKLRIAVGNLKAEFSAEPTVEEMTVENEEDGEEYVDIPPLLDVRPFTYYSHEGGLYFAEKNKAKPYNGKNTDRIIGMVEIAEQFDKVISAQVKNYDDYGLQKEQQKLNKLYDAFVAKYGYLDSKTNSSCFRDDVRSQRLMSLEIVEHDKNDSKRITHKKSDFFTKRTINTTPEPEQNSVETALEAMHVSLNLKQTVDLEYMSYLCGKDKDTIIEELDGNIYCDPTKNIGDKYSGWVTAEEYLSGNVRSKLTLASTVAENRPEFARNVKALEENQPAEVPITEIGFRLGSIYVPLDMYNQFIYDTFDTPSHLRPTYMAHRIAAEYSDLTNEWSISNKTATGRNDVKTCEVYGTKRVNAYELTEMLMNQRKAEIKDPVEGVDGKTKYVVNRDETILAREKQAKIETAFHTWVLSDPNRSERIAKIYNEKYNSIKPREFDGSYLERIEGLNESITLRPHQKNVIARIAATGTCMMAHEVGAGKTGAMAAAGMYLKSIGAINKPMYVVPNAVVGQFADEFRHWFPNANIFAATKDDLSAKNRRRFLAKVSASSFDAIIIPQSQFEKIPLSLEHQEEYYSKLINESIAAIENTDKGDRTTVKALMRQRKVIESRIEKIRASFKKDDFITFEELGCDFLFVDEAHNYKNLAMFTKMHNVAGVNSGASSQRASDMEMKCRYLQELHDGGGVVFATGTPISNSISELFVMQHYLQPDTLKALDIDYFDNWASVFGNVTQALEVKPTGDGFRTRTRFSEFVNLPELCNLFSEVFDIAKTKDMDLKLPEIEGGKPQMIICEKSPAQEHQTEIGMIRAERIEKKQVTPNEDNMLAICTYMTKVSLDGRILDPESADFDGSKVNCCIRNIVDFADKNPETAQAVFCDTNTPTAKGKDDFTVYNAIRDGLVATGKFQPSEIAFVHTADTDQKRIEMFDKVNNAQIRVIIGSTAKLGTGVNIQDRLAAIHHLDAPYRPSDVEQRNGRGIRQGNTNQSVGIYYYSTKGTFDTYRWQILEKKQNFIAQVMSGKPPARTCEDIDDVALTFAEMKAATTENPLVAEKMHVDNDVERLKLLRNDYVSHQSELKRDIEKNLPSAIKRREEQLVKVCADAEYISKDDKTDEFSITIEGKTYGKEERAEAGRKIEKLLYKYQASTEYKNYEPVSIATYKGFDVALRHVAGDSKIELSNNAKYACDFSYSGSGIITRVCNLYEKIPVQQAMVSDDIENLKKQLEAKKAQFGIPFEHESELERLLERQTAINLQLEFSSNEPHNDDIIVDNEDEEDYEPEM